MNQTLPVLSSFTFHLTRDVVKTLHIMLPNKEKNQLILDKFNTALGPLLCFLVRHNSSALREFQLHVPDGMDVDSIAAGVIPLLSSTLRSLQIHGAGKLEDATVGLIMLNASLHPREVALPV